MSEQGNPDSGQSATDPAEQESGQSAATGTAVTEETGQGAGESSSDDQVSRNEFERIKNQLSAADKKREEAERRLNEIADKDKSELDRATERAQALEKELEESRARVRELTLEKSLLADPEYGSHKWHDPEDVLTRLAKAVGDQSITVAEDGTPDTASVRRWLKDLASKRTYLVKDNGSAPPAGTSGAAVGAGKRTGESSKDADARLRSKYKIR